MRYTQRQDPTERQEIYDRTIARLARMGIRRYADQIIALAEEIEYYRAQIYDLCRAQELRPQLSIDEWSELLSKPLCDQVVGVHTPKFRRPSAPPPIPSPPQPLRPCEVDGKACVFHRWIEEDETLLKFNIMVGLEEREGMLRSFEQDKVVAPGCSLNIVRHAYALVEYPDGSMGKVAPESVCFLNCKKEK